MSDISPVAPAATTFAAAPTSSDATDELGADTFLQLLVAQLKYQDPTNPADSTEFLAQTAQFTMVEKLTELAERAESSAVVERNLAAAGLVGRTVTWKRDDGTTAEGVVSKAALGQSGPVLTVGDDEVLLDRVDAVIDRPVPEAAPDPEPTPTPSPADPQA